MQGPVVGATLRKDVGDDVTEVLGVKKRLRWGRKGAGDLADGATANPSATERRERILEDTVTGTVVRGYLLLRERRCRAVLVQVRRRCAVLVQVRSATVRRW